VVYQKEAAIILICRRFREVGVLVAEVSRQMAPRLNLETLVAQVHGPGGVSDVEIIAQLRCPPLTAPLAQCSRGFPEGFACPGGSVCHSA